MTDKSKAPARGLLALSLVVNLAAFGLLLTTPWPRPLELWTTTLILASLVVIAGIRPIRIASMRTELIATHPFIFCALATVGSAPACVIAVVGVLANSLTRESRVGAFRTGFNVGAVLLSTAVAAVVFLLLGGRPGAPLLEVLGPLSAAAVVYFIINTGLVALAISLDKKLPLMEAWRGCVQWTTLSFFLGLTLAAALVLYVHTLGDWGLILGIPPCFLLIGFYRMFKERLEEHACRVREVEAMNVGLEQRVKKRTHELEHALEQIRELQALRTTLSQTLIHDLKNPLAVVVGNLDLLERKVDEPATRLVRRSKSGASRLLKMILDLLDIDRMEESQFTVRDDPINLADVVRTVADDANVGAAEREVSIELNAPGRPTIVTGDEAIIRRVLENLLANALHFSPTGSSITISLEERHDGLDVAVGDQGPGIPEEYRERVFEKFSQGELRAAGVTANRGLGLTFCQMAIEAHGGTIRAEESPGGGALMRVHLPLASPLSVGASLHVGDLEPPATEQRHSPNLVV